MRVIAISHVGSEEDIIEAFVRHTAKFCDEMLILNHGATDATVEILQKLKAEGYALQLLHDSTLGHVEIDHADRLLKMAACDRKADWVVGLDADEFIGGALDNSFLPHPTDDETPCLKVRLRSYYPRPDDKAELLNPIERIRHRLENELEVFKVFVPGWLARQEGAHYTGGKHALTLDGNEAPWRSIPDVWLGHFSLRTAGQYAIKLASRQLQKFRHVTGRGSEVGFYDIPYRTLREEGFSGFEKCFHEMPIAWYLQARGAMVDDPMRYLGSPLRYTPQGSETDSLIHHLMEFSERLARTGEAEAKASPWPEPGSDQLTLELSALPVPGNKTVQRFAPGTGWQTVRLPIQCTTETKELHFSLVSNPGMLQIRTVRLIAATGNERSIGPEEIKSRLRVVSGALAIWSYPDTTCRLLLSRYPALFTIGGWDFRQTTPPIELVVEILYEARPQLPLILAPEVLNTLNFERHELHAKIEEQRLQIVALRRQNEDPRRKAFYQPGTIVSFKEKGNSLAYQDEGWSWPEPWGTWSDGERATLNFHFGKAPDRALKLEVMARGLVHRSHPETRVNVIVNGNRQASWVLASCRFTKLATKIPAEQLSNGSCLITFEITSPVSPAKLGLSADQRNLGIGIARLVLKV